MIVGMDDTLPFGTSARYADQTIREILWDDEGRSYLKWVYQNCDNVSFTEEVEGEL